MLRMLTDLVLNVLRCALIVIALHLETVILSPEHCLLTHVARVSARMAISCLRKNAFKSGISITPL